jgi:hypothetical protein
VTPEFAERMTRNGAAGKGRPKSAETRAKMSAAQAADRPVLTDAIVREIKQLLADSEIGGRDRARVRHHAGRCLIHQAPPKLGSCDA